MLHKLLRTRAFCAWRGHPLSEYVTGMDVVHCPCRHRTLTGPQMSRRGGFLL